ncbi:NB-ARC domain-containing protein [Oryzobacter sp. R7]|uniref:NB-ARC domain-containing protein n=1 Tax=Oryzobacter faecalis TaxID=3388656 RepID=UPI00398CCFE0
MVEQPPRRGWDSMDYSALSVDGLTYELTNKAFRNPVLEHARSRLSQTLGADLDSAIEKLFSKEWASICASLDIAKAKGIDRRPLDALDRLSVNHFYSLFEKFYFDLVPSDAIPEGDAAKATRRKFFTWMEQVKDTRNPNAHPPSMDLSVYDALTLADACIRIVKFLQLQAAVAGIQIIQRELLRRAAEVDPGDLTIDSMLQTLPSREAMYDRFVGRTDELEALWAWFADDQARRWVLVGDGGKGKSSIAYQFATSVSIANPQGTAAVLWLSAKKRRFEQSEIQAIMRPDFEGLETALDRLLRDFGDVNNLDKTLEVKREVVLKLLSDFPSLLIVDDIDSIEEREEDVVEFFTYDAPRTKSKVLLTSRRMYPGMAKSSTRITGLDPGDAREYFQLTAERLGLADRPGLDTAFDKIYDATEGSPLYMEDLLRLCRQLKVREAIDRWKQQRGDAARRYALQRECDLLSDSARNCLEATCWARAPLSIAQMEAILGIGQDDAVSAVQELESRFLVPTPELVEGVPSYRAHRNLELIVRQDVRADPTKLWLRNAVESALKVTVKDSETADVYRQASVRLRGGRLAEALEVAESALSGNPGSPDLLALRAEVLAAQRPPRMIDARQDWSRAFDLGLRRREGYVRWAQAEDRAGDWKRMHEAAEHGLKRCGDSDSGLLRLSGYAASRIGQTLVRGLDFESGQEWLEKAEKTLRKSLVELKRLGASDYERSKVYRALVVNSQFLRDKRRDSQVVYWTLRWLEDVPGPDSIEEARRQAGKYAEVRERLEQGSGRVTA